MMVALKSPLVTWMNYQLYSSMKWEPGTLTRHSTASISMGVAMAALPDLTGFHLFAI